MLSFLKNHPFDIEAFFDYSAVLTFAFPKDKLSGLIPECLELDTFNDEWAFIAVAFVQTRELRPKGLPKFLGNEFMLIGYRVFVKYTNNAGKRLRGLYIIKSQTDKKKMEYLGNIFTHYNYERIDLLKTQHKNIIVIDSKKSNFRIEAEAGIEHIDLPFDSPFANWKEARRYAGPLPFTFAYNSTTQKVLIVEGIRQNWLPEPLNVTHYHIPFINSLTTSPERLANAFIINNVSYRWKKGIKEQWHN